VFASAPRWRGTILVRWHLNTDSEVWRHQKKTRNVAFE
jgi:hypothetical protein